MRKIKQENAELKEHIAYLEAQLEKKELEYKPTFKCMLKLIDEDTSFVRIIPTDYRIIDGDTVEFTAKFSNSDFNTKQIAQLKQQLAEKGKEIKSKNDKLCELKQQLKDCQKALKRKTQSNRDLQHLKHNAKTEFAIEKLQKVREIAVEQFDLDKCNIALARVLDKLDAIIKELEGK